MLLDRGGTAQGPDELPLKQTGSTIPFHRRIATPLRHPVREAPAGGQFEQAVRADKAKVIIQRSSLAIEFRFKIDRIIAPPEMAVEEDAKIHSVSGDIG